jgi:hypothetical protein
MVNIVQDGGRCIKISYAATHLIIIIFYFKKTIKKLEADLEQESNDEEEAELQKELDIAQAALDEAKKKKNVPNFYFSIFSPN